MIAREIVIAIVIGMGNGNGNVIVIVIVIGSESGSGNGNGDYCETGAVEIATANGSENESESQNGNVNQNANVSVGLNGLNGLNGQSLNRLSRAFENCELNSNLATADSAAVDPIRVSSASANCPKTDAADRDSRSVVSQLRERSSRADFGLQRLRYARAVGAAPERVNEPVLARRAQNGTDIACTLNASTSCIHYTADHPVVNRENRDSSSHDCNIRRVQTDTPSVRVCQT